MASGDEEIGNEGIIAHTQIHTQAKRKGSIGLKTWLVVSEFGLSRLEEVSKQSIMRRTGLPARDLRALDPVLSYPSSILGRERAIVVNLEHIKAIITAKEILILNSTNPLVVQFVQDLQHRIVCANCAPQQAMGSNDMEMEEATNTTWVSSSLQFQNDSVAMPTTELKDKIPKTTMNMPVATCPKALPFEFRALEACLESTCRCLESETETLEEEAYPALDELTSKISTLNLERVRQIKSRLVAISGRVQKVRDELEHLLDDDNDMAEMYLTEKLAARSLDQASLKEEFDNDAFEVEDERDEDDETKSENSSGISTDPKPNVEELEMLLEAYFAQIDGILQKISDMSEYVDDTEDFINIMLDDKQNQLLHMGVMLSTANMIVNAGIVVFGLFGMNIHITLFDGQPIQFWETTGGTIVGCFALYAIAYWWAKKKNLLAF